MRIYFCEVEAFLCFYDLLFRYVLNSTHSEDEATELVNCSFALKKDKYILLHLIIIYGQRYAVNNYDYEIL